MFREDLTHELDHYYPCGEQIVTAFVDSINAYVKEMRANPDLLPIEFEIRKVDSRECVMM